MCIFANIAWLPADRLFIILLIDLIVLQVCKHSKVDSHMLDA
jgi:hypothetical protein